MSAARAEGNTPSVTAISVVTCRVRTAAQRSHEEADTRIIVRVIDAAKNACKRIIVRTVDTDMLVYILVGQFHQIKKTPQHRDLACVRC